jgi:hypothetical protein
VQTMQVQPLTIAEGLPKPGREGYQSHKAVK